MNKPNSNHPFGVTRLDVLWKHVLHNKIPARYIPQMLQSFAFAHVFLPFGIAEKMIYDGRIKKTDVKQPLFVLGHWRSGTTLMQNILSRDPSRGYADPIVGYQFNYCLTLRWALEPDLRKRLPNTRPVDNMEYKMELPVEEYVGFFSLYEKACWSHNAFPQRRWEYFNYAFVDELPEKEQIAFKKKYLYMLKKISFINKGKPLVLKSPDSTAHSLVLKNMFPDAKFINIYRNPYTVVRSTLHLYESDYNMWNVQDTPSKEEMLEFVVTNFARMYRKYFDDVKKIPEKDVFEIKFEDFERDPATYIKQAYENLGLDYAVAENSINEYISTLKGYQKNEYDYPKELIHAVNEKCGFYFEHYGYEMIKE